MITINFIKQRDEYDNSSYGLVGHMVPLPVRVNPTQWDIHGIWKIEGITGKSGQGYSTWHLYPPDKLYRSRTTIATISLGLLATDHNEYYWNIGQRISEDSPMWKLSYPNCSRGSLDIHIQPDKLVDTITIIGLTVKQVIAINGKS